MFAPEKKRNTETKEQKKPGSGYKIPEEDVDRQRKMVNENTYIKSNRLLTNKER